MSFPQEFTSSGPKRCEPCLRMRIFIDGTALTGSNLTWRSNLHGRGRLEPGPPARRTHRSDLDIPRGPDAESRAAGVYAGLSGCPRRGTAALGVVLEGFASRQPGQPVLHAVSGNALAREVVLAYGAGAKFMAWPPSTCAAASWRHVLERTALTCSAGSRMQVAGRAFATPADSGYGAATLTLAVVSHCPDFSEAMGRHFPKLSVP